jgi:hypothetical protein
VSSESETSSVAVGSPSPFHTAVAADPIAEETAEETLEKKRLKIVLEVDEIKLLSDPLERLDAASATDSESPPAVLPLLFAPAP